MKQRFSPVIFSLTFCFAYALVFWFNIPLFLYYPLTGQFRWGSSPLQDVGPGMAWYGLMADAALAGGIAAMILPDRLVTRWLRSCLWVAPCLALVICLYLLRVFFR